MKNIWSSLCARALIDQRTNALSLIDCIDEITINFVSPEEMSAATKNIPLAFELVSLWHDDVNKDQERILAYTIEIYDPKGDKISEFKNQAKFETSKTRLRTITGINGLKITSEGKYLFQVKEGSGSTLNLVTEIPVDIKFLLNIKR
jgi:hypothetical protein